MAGPTVSGDPRGDAALGDVELGAAIEAARESVVAAGKLLVGRANEVFISTSTFIGGLGARQVDGFVLGQPERTSALGVAGVEKVKAKLAAWQAGVPLASAKRLRAVYAWTFPEPPLEIGDAERTPLFLGDRELPWIVADTIRSMVGEAAEIAREARFVVTPPSSFEFEPDGAVRRFAAPLDVAPRVRIALRSYSDARLRYFRTLRRLRRLEARKAAADRRIEAEVEEESRLAPARWLWSEIGKSA